MSEQQRVPRWRKLSSTEYAMALPHGWHLRVIFANGQFWMWQLLAGPLHRSGVWIHGSGGHTVDVVYPDALACKQAAVLYARNYFREMSESL